MKRQLFSSEMKGDVAESPARREQHAQREQHVQIPGVEGPLSPRGEPPATVRDWEARQARRVVIRLAEQLGLEVRALERSQRKLFSRSHTPPESLPQP